MKVKVLKSYYDPLTEEWGHVGEVKDITQELYLKAKNLFEPKSKVEFNDKVVKTIKVKAKTNKTKTKRRKK